VKQPFRTVIQTKPSDWKISHQDEVLMLGSCFAVNIGGKLKKEKFNVTSNPMGTLFNPHSISVLISRAIDEQPFKKEEFFQKDDLWHHWQLNNNFSSSDIEKQLLEANQQLDLLGSSLINSDYLFLTLGTSWVYKNKTTQEFVANCHKVPAANFDKSCLTVGESTNILKQILASVSSVNSNLKIVFTVSPVRHWKDGAEENFKSKSILRTAIDQVVGEEVRYFPSYEIMMDDLRDYRFYKEDMLHPSDQAVDYIYQVFGETYYGEETKDLVKKVNAIVGQENHRAVNPESKGHQLFLDKLEKSKSALFTEYKYLVNRWL